MKRFVSVAGSMIVISTAMAAVVDNVQVNMTQAPSNYQVTYQLTLPSGMVAEVEATLSDNNGQSYSFSPKPGQANIPMVCEGDVFQLMTTSGAKSFSLTPTALLAIPNAKVMVSATLYDAATTNIGVTWACATSNAPWSGRVKLQCVVFSNTLWVIGGEDTNDVWSSADGTNWTLVTAGAPWSIDGYNRCVVNNGRIWLIRRAGDVWTTMDGTNWVCATTLAPWSGRHDYGCLSFNGKLWILGGDKSGQKSDVWSSGDGTNWTRVVPCAGWSPRSMFLSAVYMSRMWIMAGYSGDNLLYDTWSASDGEHWLQAATSASVPWRNTTSCLEYGDRLWIIAGYDEFSSGTLSGDIWSSTDGRAWRMAADNLPWGRRGHHGAVVFNNRIWLLGGYNGSAYMNDVWYTPAQ